MDHSITFTVSLDDMIGTQRLATRRYALGAGILELGLGLAIAVLVNPAGLVIAAIGGLTLLAWRFPLR